MDTEDFDDIERRLQRYRPAGPPPDLRARAIAAAMVRRARWREWIPAAAALTMAILFYALATSTRSHVAARVAPFEAADEYVFRTLTEDDVEMPQREAIERLLWLRARETQVAEDVQ